ncbi:unnamed protein product [Brugia timori]|uniref:Uncharacterized protein n=1 Tax=Brugia timori TaxID=42155 RepID=A0A3P7T9K5_9BILA|nr:unnamed protein product [Brugia timori]
MISRHLTALFKRSISVMNGLSTKILHTVPFLSPTNMASRPGGPPMTFI